MGSSSSGETAPLPIVLVAEDDDVHRRTICDLLNEQGYQTFEATNGQEALDCLLYDCDFQPPALVLLDLAMPVMTGWELLAARHVSVRLEQFDFVLISGSEPHLDPDTHGTVAGFLRKPYALSALLDTVDDFFKGASRERPS
jgi:two-component system response regulator CpxR